MNRDELVIENFYEVIAQALAPLESEGYTFTRDEGSAYVICRDAIELVRIGAVVTDKPPYVSFPVNWSHRDLPDANPLLFTEFESAVMRRISDAVASYVFHLGFRGDDLLLGFPLMVSLSELEWLLLTGGTGANVPLPVKEKDLGCVQTTSELLENYLERLMKNIAHEYGLELPVGIGRFCGLNGVRRTPTEYGVRLVEMHGQHCIKIERGSSSTLDCSRSHAMIQFELVPLCPQELRLTARCMYSPLMGLFEELLDAIRRDYGTAKQVMIDAPKPAQETALFHDFELLIADRQRRGYPVRVIESPAGQAEGLFKMPWKHDDLQQTLLDMEEWQADEASLVDFGTRLFDALFTGDVRARYSESVGLAAGDAGLRIRLRLEPPELHELPWELLYDPEKREFLALSKRALVTRYLHVPRPTPPLAVTPPLRLLVVTATPKDWNPLNVEQEVERIGEAVQPLIDRGLVQLRVEEHITRRSLRKRLLDDAPHMLHYIGHGDFDDERGMLILEDSSRLSDPLDGRTLATLLKETPVRLAVLNCCLGAKGAAADARQFGRKRAALLGVGPALVDAGLGAVIAMQFSADDEAAVVFAQDFYEMVSHFKPIDEAVGRAREMVMLHSGTENRDWATPVLFMRAPDGRLFEATRIYSEGLPPYKSDEARDRVARSIGTIPQEETMSTHDLQAIEAERCQNLLEQLATQQRNLNKLELQSARCGMDVPLKLSNEIDVVKQRIEAIKRETTELGCTERDAKESS